MSDPITPAELAEMKQRCDSATAGPWLRDAERDRTIFSASGEMIGGVLYNTKGGEDADFIANARTDMPRLIAEVERLRTELAAAKIAAGATDRVANDAARETVECVASVEKFEPGMLLMRHESGWEVWDSARGTIIKNVTLHAALTAAKGK